MSDGGTERQRWADLILARRCSSYPTDEDAWQELWSRFQGLVGWRALQILPPEIRHEAEDVTQEVFIRFRDAASKYDPEEASLATFLALLARSTARDWERKRRRERAQTVRLAGEETIASAAGPEIHPDRLLAEGRKRLVTIRNANKRKLFSAFLELQTPDQVHVELRVPLSTAYRMYASYRAWLSELAGSVLAG